MVASRDGGVNQVGKARKSGFEPLRPGLRRRYNGATHGGEDEAVSERAEDPIDPHLLTRLGERAPGPRRLEPSVREALGHPMKPFVLWDVARELLEPGRMQTERAERATLELRRARPSLPRVRPVCSEALRRFVPASRQAQRAHKGLRAALRLLLRKPIPRPVRR